MLYTTSIRSQEIMLQSCYKVRNKSSRSDTLTNNALDDHEMQDLV